MLSDDIQLHDALKGLIVNNIEKGFWLAIEENIPATYKNAQNILAKALKSIPLTRPLPQFRHYLIGDMLSNLCTTAEPEMHWADNSGELYVLLRSGKLTIGYSLVNHDQSKPRTAKYRQQMAFSNDVLTPYQYCWIDNEQLKKVKEELALHLSIIIVNPEKSCEQESVPSEILITIPYSNWSGYHLKIPLNEMIKSYESESVDVYDGAWGTLRKDLMQEESKTD